MSPAGASETLNEERRQAIQAELERILASSMFRGTRRSQEFLRYVVASALEGKTDGLKERTIGMEVFDRPADYDTGDDSIVRVKANEVRKRLAQYYGEAGAPAEVQIDLPAGSYAPEFRWQTPGSSSSPTVRSRVVRNLIVAGSVAAVLVVLAWTWAVGSGSAIEEFWRPVLHDSQPVLLAVAHPVVYHLTGSSRETPDSVVPMADIIRDPDHYVGVGDAFALARFTEFFTRARKPSSVRISADTTFADLRNSPAVLIGAYTNQWTMQMTQDLRFVFDRDGGSILIRDQSTAGHRWVYTRTDPPTDYAIVSRVFDSRTGDLIVVAAGLSHFGTQVAGEFLTSEAQLAEALREAPRGWQRKNLQMVLRAEVIGRTPGPARVLATHFW